MRSLPVGIFVAFSSLFAFLPGEASAHLGLDEPTSRYGPDVLKTGPCGSSGGERTGRVTYYEPGETIEVVWDEYIDHPGHYRISFDENGDDDFVDPATMMEFYSNDAVLLDNITDKGSGERDYIESVTLPDISCDNCTLQVIQVMYDKPPYATPGNDIYYQCADLVLRIGGAPPDAGIGDDAGTDPATPGGSGCRAVRGETGLPAAVLGLALCLLARRLARQHGLPV